jgi:phenylacetaldehyde dehydrogenase
LARREVQARLRTENGEMETTRDHSGSECKGRREEEALKGIQREKRETAFDSRAAGISLLHTFVVLSHQAVKSRAILQRFERIAESIKNMVVSSTEIVMAPEVRRFLAQPHKLLIDGQWVEAASGNVFPVYNPATGEILAHAAKGDKEDIDRAVQAARSAFDRGPWRTMTPSQRGISIWRLAELLEQHAEEFAQLESLDNGKPLTEARAADVPLAIDLFRYMAGWASKIEGNTMPLSMPGQYFAYTLREPVGVVGQIIPWNFPLLMAAWKLGPALAAGCTVILKPASLTPLSALRLGELFVEAGFPPGVINIVTGPGQTAGAALAAHPDVDKIAITGSTDVGKQIVHAATGNLKKVSLELGGKSPNIVLKDADMEVAIPGAANAIFFNQGQVCCAGSRLYIEQGVFEQVTEGVAQHAKKIKMGPGLDLSTQMGPLISDQQLHLVSRYVESGLASGATALSGGHRYGEHGYFLEPTVLTDVQENMQVVQEEIFGPVVVALPFKDLGEILPLANDTMYGLAAGIWTRDLSKAHLLAAQLHAGTVWINCYNVFDAAMPFGGYKQSGWGREMGHEVLENYTEVKSVCIKL